MQVLDFGAARDGVPEENRGRRIVVDVNGNEITSDATDEGKRYFIGLSGGMLTKSDF